MSLHLSTPQRQALEDFYEDQYGPLHDVVATHGQYLVSGGSTPALPSQAYFNRTFYEDLVEALRLLQEQIIMRPQLYGDEAKESRPAHTPPELRAQHQSKEELHLREFIYTMVAPTPSSSGASTPRRFESVETHATTPPAPFPPTLVEATKTMGTTRKRPNAEGDTDMEEDARKKKRRQDEETPERAREGHSRDAREHTCKIPGCEEVETGRSQEEKLEIPGVTRGGDGEPRGTGAGSGDPRATRAGGGELGITNEVESPGAQGERVESPGVARGGGCPDGQRQEIASPERVEETQTRLPKDEIWEPHRKDDHHGARHYSERHSVSGHPIGISADPDVMSSPCGSASSTLSLSSTPTLSTSSPEILSGTPAVVSPFAVKTYNTSAFSHSPLSTAITATEETARASPGAEERRKAGQAARIDASVVAFWAQSSVLQMKLWYCSSGP
ncbi:hypothetical protein BU26DRAFT_546589 [Trematosphaeria pertusa]|uniref:Uncharacterized protein n=1 Tax=Trematosphaeria pertusa TaxID=390896 RepID=A0A6A6IV44_9PLEO|nr:uncharacterized protein BU26DRAFT_546589 [Trematosphaeria pertusa]KAF2254299.1 hypothetical protein BU26DRAFT_546589 [Trematosphaeria pertusa]